MKTYKFKKVVQRFFHSDDYLHPEAFYHHHRELTLPQGWVDDTMEYEGCTFRLCGVTTWYTDYQGRPDSVTSIDVHSPKVTHRSLLHLQNEQGCPVVVEFSNEGPVRVTTKLNKYENHYQDYQDGICISEHVFDERDFLSSWDEDEEIVEDDEDERESLYHNLDRYDPVEFNEQGDPTLLVSRYNADENKPVFSIMICEYEY